MATFSFAIVWILGLFGFVTILGMFFTKTSLMCPRSWWKMTLKNLLNLWEYVSGQLMKPIFFFFFLESNEANVVLTS